MEGGGGAQLLLISFATTRLHGICNGSINRMEDGGTHSGPAALGLGISVPTHPKLPSFSLGLGGGKKVFYPPRPDNKRFNIYKPGSHSQPCLCPHGLLFFQQSCF